MTQLSPEMLAFAAERYRRLQLETCFDPNNFQAKPTLTQQELFQEFGSIRKQWIVAGNQCLAKGTLIATPQGPVAIEDLRPNDTVYDEHGKPIKVLKTFVNGPKKVVGIYGPDLELLAEATAEHVWLSTEGQLPTARLHEKQLIVYGKESITAKILNTRIVETYDIHVDSETNLYLLANGLVTHNSGKSQSCSRLTAWVFAENHPYWKRPKEWGQEPLLILVCGRTGKQLEDSLIPRICAYLPDSDYKVIRVGNMVQRLEHKNGNRIVFQSLENANLARERVQSYVAHLVWVDEMPSASSLIDELQTRLYSKSGYFLASFTPLVYNPDIRKMVDNARLPDAKVYRFKMFDNPLYASAEKQREVLAAYAHLSETALNCRLYGEWMEPESAVWSINREQMVVAPPNYHPSWRHVEASDPAVSSKFGLTIWAEDPSTSIWYCIRDDYIEGIAAPDDIVQEVIRKTSSLNIVRRICDPHETWYLGQATKAKLSYLCPKKDGRKDELIKNLQTALSSGRIKIAPWCTRLLSELEGAHWSEADTNRSRIVGGSKLHLGDTSQYFVDLIPAPSSEYILKPWHQELREGNEKRKELALEAAKLKVGKKKRWILR